MTVTSRADGSHLDEAIARLLGWRQLEAGEPRGRDSCYLKSGYWMPPGKQRREGRRRPPPFSADIALAMEILESWSGDFDIRRQNGQWRVNLLKAPRVWAAWAETLPLAICRARLAVLEAPCGAGDRA